MVEKKNVTPVVHAVELPAEVAQSLRRKGGKPVEDSWYLEQALDAERRYHEEVKAERDPANLAFFIALPEGDLPATHLNQLRKALEQSGMKDRGLRLRVFDKSTSVQDFAPHGYLGYRVVPVKVEEPSESVDDSDAVG